MEGNIVRELYEEFCDSVEIFYEKLGKWRYPFIVTLPFIVGVIVCMLDFWVLAYYTGMIGTSIIHMLALLFNIVFLIMWRQWGSYMLKKGKSRILSSFLTHSVHLFVMIVLVFLSIDHQTPPSPPVEDFNFVKWTPIYELLPKFYCMGSMGILASSMLWSTWNNLAYIGISSLSFSACVFSYGYGKARRAEIKAGNLKKNSYEKFCDRIEDFYKKLGKWGYPFVWILPMLTGTAGCLLNLWAASEVGIIIGFILEIFALLIAALHLLLWVKWSEVQFKMGKSMILSCLLTHIVYIAAVVVLQMILTGDTTYIRGAPFGEMLLKFYCVNCLASGVSNIWYIDYAIYALIVSILLYLSGYWYTKKEERQR